MNFIKPIRLLAVVLAVLSAVFSTNLTAEEPLKTFILAGQSNMVGWGDSTKLPAGLREGNNRVVMFENGEWQPLRPHQPAMENQKRFGMNEFSFGPEIGFGHELAKAFPNEKIGIIKFASGGSSILAWKPNWSREDADRIGQGGRGSLYKAMMEKIEQAQAKKKIKIVGFLWQQGGRDMTNVEIAKEYLDNLKSLVASVRKDTGADALTFLYGSPRTADHPDDLTGLEPKVMKGRPGAQWVVKAQWDAQTEIPNSKMVINRDLETHPKNVHYNTAGQLALGKQYAGAFKETLQQRTKPKARKPDKYDATVPNPTESRVRYGDHERHVLDFWKAESDAPTPLVFIIHGGGWQGGSKERANRFADVAQLLKAGISVTSLNYRYVRQAVQQGIEPPVKAPLHDAARALQFVRSKAKEWNLDKKRIGAAGGSAGACSSLWIAFHDDLAKPMSEDIVERESTRLWCAAVIGAQTTLDPQQMRQWTPNSKYGGHAFGLPNFSAFLSSRNKILPWISEYSPYALVSADDPPVYLFYGSPPAIGKPQKDPTHTSNFGIKLQEHCESKGVACELAYPGAKDVKHETPTDYLIATLKSKEIDAP